MTAAPVGLSTSQFERAFPFHVVVDPAGRLVQVGHVLARLCPTLQPGIPFTDVLTVSRPHQATTFAAMREHASSLFILRVKEPALTLRGQIVVDDERELALFLGSPWITRIEEATALGLSLSDFASHDSVGEFLLLFRTKDMALSDAEGLAERLRVQSGALRLANERLEAQEEVLRDANEALLRAAQLKDEFLSSMSHELRTPLNAILGVSESLQEGVYGDVLPRQRQALALVESSGRHLLDLINDILDLSRIEAGRLDLDIEPVDVAAVCQAALGMVRPAAMKKQLAVGMTLDARVATLPADQRRLKQVLVNLLSNAVKFTPPGGSVALTVTSHDAEGEARFAVADTGIGIARDNLPRLFTPFVQLDGGLARHHEGTGLGLALTRRMVELHGGWVDVESEPGVGSTFTVALPWKPVCALPAPELKDVERTSAAPAAARILVIDDHASNRSVLVDFLRARHYDVVEAGGAADGLRLARDLKPDLILIDVQMPDMDGLQATQAMRRDPVLASTPVFAVTGLAMKGDRERCLAAGVDDYFAKPVRLVELADRIRARLGTPSSAVSVG